MNFLDANSTPFWKMTATKIPATTGGVCAVEHGTDGDCAAAEGDTMSSEGNQGE